jgi:hypothetical protein
MSGMADMARSFAASGDGGMGADAGSPDMQAQDPNAPDDSPEMGGGGESLEQGIMMIESGLSGLPGDLAEKARKFVEGLKEIAVQAAAAGGGSPDDQSAQSPDGGDASAIEQAPGSGPSMGGSPMSP